MTDNFRERKKGVEMGVTSDVREGIISPATGVMAVAGGGGGGSDGNDGSGGGDSAHGGNDGGGGGYGGGGGCGE